MSRILPHVPSRFKNLKTHPKGIKFDYIYQNIIHKGLVYNPKYGTLYVPIRYGNQKRGELQEWIGKKFDNWGHLDNYLLAYNYPNLMKEVRDASSRKYLLDNN